MALNATIYKVDLQVADTDRHYYNNHALTIARHPSETLERMITRVIVFALHADENLAFTKGLSQADEPDLWRKDLTGSIELWIEVGQPTETRLLKACGKADQVIVYCFNAQPGKLWWESVRKKTERARNLKVVCLPNEAIKTLASKFDRNMDFHVNIQENEIFVPFEDQQISMQPEVWQDFKA